MAANKFYRDALEQKRQHKQKMLAEYDRQKSLVYEKYPRLCELDRELSAIGAGIAVTALSGNMQKLNELKESSLALSAEKDRLLAGAGLRQPEFECPVCKDTGMVGNEYCGCVKERARLLMLSELDREMPIAQSSFENFDLAFYSDKPDENGTVPRKRMTQILKACREYVLHFPKNAGNMIFIGGAGLGKTHLSLAIVSGITQKGCNVIYSPAQKLFDTIEKEHFAYSGNEQYLDAVLNADLLVIDDLGTEFTTSFTQAVIYNIINSRILTKKPTIINTNLSPAELESRYTSRIFSRFIGEYEFKLFCGGDIRQKKAFAAK